jgi:hypothetical protein
LIFIKQALPAFGDRLISSKESIYPQIFQLSRGRQILTPPDGFSKVFYTLSDIAGHKAIRLAGNCGHENRLVLFRQIGRARDVPVHLGDPLDFGQKNFQFLILLRVNEGPCPIQPSWQINGRRVAMVSPKAG